MEAAGDGADGGDGDEKDDAAASGIRTTLGGGARSTVSGAASVASRCNIKTRHSKS
jgi:hypothetical protein